MLKGTKKTEIGFFTHLSEFDSSINIVVRFLIRLTCQLFLIIATKLCSIFRTIVIRTSTYSSGVDDGIELKPRIPIIRNVKQGLTLGKKRPFVRIKCLPCRIVNHYIVAFHLTKVRV